VALNALGSNRDQLAEMNASVREQLIRDQVLVGDPRRWRPRWFDGRFLAASDLQAEQNYFLVRQADLARAGGSGIIDGLMVSATRASATELGQLRIEAGQGVTDTGELVVLFEPLTVEPANVPEIQRLDAAFGLQMIPNEVGRTRTGLYVLALRPVEWSANPIGAYPTSLTGKRTVEDSTIVEGVAVTLIPYPEQGTEDTAGRRRARVAREVFVEGRDRGTFSGVLALALVSLRGNIVEWIDPFMVRREAGAERPAGVDFGFGNRALREAHLLQYQQHLADAFEALNGQPFPATADFDALPPVGQFPSGTIDANALTQRFFPPGVEVELSFVPEDELAAILEEALMMPPIDLTAGAEQLQGTGVIVLVPLSRSAFAASRADLPNWDADLPRLRPAVLTLKALATPRERLLSRLFTPVIPVLAPPEEEAWRQLLRTALNLPLLWYVRRRHLPIPSNVAGTPVAADNPAVSNPARLATMVLADATLADAFTRLKRVNAPEVDALTRRLTETRFLEDPVLMRDLVVRAAGPAGTTPTVAAAVTALAPAADKSLGEGLVRLAPEPEARASLEKIVGSGGVVEVDKLAQEVPADRLAEFRAALKTEVTSADTAPQKLAALRTRFVR
jgi:hypothetical protein